MKEKGLTADLLRGAFEKGNENRSSRALSPDPSGGARRTVPSRYCCVLRLRRKLGLLSACVGASHFLLLAVEL